MWKYIIIAAVVLFLGACFLFFKNNEALTGPEGEVAAYQSQFEMAKKKAVDIEKDKAIKRYAELRQAYFKQLTDKNNEERAALEAEDAPFDQEITKANADLDTAKADFKSYKDKFQNFQKGAAEHAGVEAMDEEESLDLVGQRIAEMVSENDALEAKVNATLASTENLEAAAKLTQEKIEAAKKLAAQRMARISPDDLKCTVASVDSTWDYVILDAGIDKGIVIGSRLVVMRGETKVCELAVTLVEGNKSSCDVIYSTMRPGDRVRPGDTVVTDNK